MGNQDYSSILEFVELSENDKALAIVRLAGCSIGLTLSVEHGNDMEVFMRHSESVRLVNILQEAIQKNEIQIVQKIETLVKADLSNFPHHLFEWAENHLITPRQMTFAKNHDGTGEIALWLVTDHTKSQDCSSRIVYDEVAESFGLVMDMKNEVKWFMGLFGGFTEAINAM